MYNVIYCATKFLGQQRINIPSRCYWWVVIFRQAFLFPAFLKVGKPLCTVTTVSHISLMQATEEGNEGF